MKLLIVLLAFVTLTTELLHSQDAWQRQFYESPSMVTCIYFINENTGWAVGYAGSIVNTKNGGELWETQISGTSEKLNSVYFLNSDTGFISGDGLILRTFNSGLNWDKIAIDTLINGKKIEFIESYFKNIDTGCFLGAVWQFNLDVAWEHWYFLKSYDGLRSFDIVDKGNRYSISDIITYIFLTVIFSMRTELVTN